MARVEYWEAQESDDRAKDEAAAIRGARQDFAERRYVEQRKRPEQRKSPEA